MQPATCHYLRSHLALIVVAVEHGTVSTIIGVTTAVWKLRNSKPTCCLVLAASYRCEVTVRIDSSSLQVVVLSMWVCSSRPDSLMYDSERQGRQTDAARELEGS